MIAGMAIFAYLFVTGLAPSPDTTMSEWNCDPRSWTFAVWAMVVCCLIVMTLIFKLRGFWFETDTEADKKNRQFEAMVEYSPDAILIFDLDAGKVAAAIWTCRGFVPPQVLVQAALRSNATGPFQPKAECRRRGF